MKILSVSLENFASYEKLDFNFEAQGLTLIQGPTGSGKSTLCDAIPWILFGRTAKDGAVDEILSWPGKKITKGTTLIDTGKSTLLVSRTRGNKANDLWFCEENDKPQRGKDLNDTQNLINRLLDTDLYLYLSGSYFHEFSQTAQFFTTTPKNRRQICEQLADLSVANKLQNSNTAKTKEAQQELLTLSSAIDKLKSNIDVLKKVQLHETTKKDKWQQDHELKITRLKDKREQHTTSRNIILEELAAKMEADIHSQLNDTVCSECGAPKTVNPLIKPKSKFEALIDAELVKLNPYIVQIAEAKREVNPHTDSVKDYNFEIADKNKLCQFHENKAQGLIDKINDSNLLSDILVEFRSIIVRNVIIRVEQNTNDLLSEYFDAEIRVGLDVTQADKLEVTTTKDGNDCAYTQLSKGQRQILKLCFGVSVMQEVSNHHGINFNTLWFDEALDGMDDNTKLKAIRIFEKLATKHESVFIVEHSETIKAFISNKYNVELVNGNSEIEKV